ncbi:hypothetical protein [Actinokineospora sp. NPDC004072]
MRRDWLRVCTLLTAAVAGAATANAPAAVAQDETCYIKYQVNSGELVDNTHFMAAFDDPDSNQPGAYIAGTDVHFEKLEKGWTTGKTGKISCYVATHPDNKRFLAGSTRSKAKRTTIHNLVAEVYDTRPGQADVCKKQYSWSSSSGLFIMGLHLLRWEVTKTGDCTNT